MTPCNLLKLKHSIKNMLMRENKKKSDLKFNLNKRVGM